MIYRQKMIKKELHEYLSAEYRVANYIDVVDMSTIHAMSTDICNMFIAPLIAQSIKKS